MVVATYNVHRCVGIDGREDVARVAAVVRELEADVIGLQEVDCQHPPILRSQLDRLAAATGYVAIAGPTLSHKRRGSFGNALLLRARPTAIRRLDLAVAGREPRGAIAVTLPAPHHDWRIVVTHLGLRAYERLAQAERLLTSLREEDGAARPTPLVLLGDLNEWSPRPRALRRLERHFAPSMPLRSFPAARPTLALDRILVRAPGGLHDVRVHVSKLARQASDHLPVRGVVSDGSRRRH